MAAGGIDVGHFGAEMGHRPPLPEQFDLDGHRTVGHLGDEGGVEGA